MRFSNNCAVAHGIFKEANAKSAGDTEWCDFWSMVRDGTLALCQITVQGLLIGCEKVDKSAEHFAK